jgi:hypothetical protein
MFQQQQWQQQHWQQQQLQHQQMQQQHVALPGAYPYSGGGLLPALSLAAAVPFSADNVPAAWPLAASLPAAMATVFSPLAWPQIAPQLAAAAANLAPPAWPLNEPLVAAAAADLADPLSERWQARQCAGSFGSGGSPEHGFGGSGSNSSGDVRGATRAAAKVSSSCISSASSFEGASSFAEVPLLAHAAGVSAPGQLPADGPGSSAVAETASHEPQQMQKQMQMQAAAPKSLARTSSCGSSSDA